MTPVHELVKPVAATMMPRNDGLRGKNTVVGLLICILSSWPLSQLSRKVASLLTVLLTALLAILQRARERTPLTEHGETMCLDTLDGDRHEILFLGDAGVGKTTLKAALRMHVPAHLGGSSVSHAQPSRVGPTGGADDHLGLRGSRRCAVVVWTSQRPETMRAYANRWRAVAAATVGARAPMFVVCNMTDVAPCPLPEMNAMRGTKIPALAVSAARGTNLGALWLLIERAIATAPPAVSPVPSRAFSPVAQLQPNVGDASASSGERSGGHAGGGERGDDRRHSGGGSGRGGSGSSVDSGDDGRNGGAGDGARDSTRERDARPEHCSSPPMTATGLVAGGSPRHEQISRWAHAAGTSSASVEEWMSPQPAQAEDASTCACIGGGSSPSPASILYQHEYGGAFDFDFVASPRDDGGGREPAFEHSISAMPSVAIAA